jgi:hypothetical protein
MRIQIVKPAAEELYDATIDLLLTRIKEQVEDTSYIVASKAQIISDLSSAFRDLVESAHLIVEQSTDEAAGSFVPINDPQLRLPERLRNNLDNLLGRDTINGKKHNPQ